MWGDVCTRVCTCEGLKGRRTCGAVGGLGGWLQGGLQAVAEGKAHLSPRCSLGCRTRWSDPIFKRSQNLKFQAKLDSKGGRLTNSHLFPWLADERERSGLISLQGSSMQPDFLSLLSAEPAGFACDYGAVITSSPVCFPAVPRPGPASSPEQTWLPPAANQPWREAHHLPPLLLALWSPGPPTPRPRASSNPSPAPAPPKSL